MEESGNFKITFRKRFAFLIKEFFLKTFYQFNMDSKCSARTQGNKSTPNILIWIPFLNYLRFYPFSAETCCFIYQHKWEH